MSILLEKIKTRGFWEVTIRPTHFKEKKISNIADLYELLRKCSVRLRGWDFPHLESREKVDVGIDWIQQEFEWSQFLEFLRFYQSGQFMHLTGMHEDWEDQAHWGKPPQGWTHGIRLGTINTIFQFTEIFEFAARLSATQAGDDTIHIEVTLHNLKGRTLWVDEMKRVPFTKEYTATIEQFPYKLDVAREELRAKAKDLALIPAAELFQRFRWNPEMKALKDVQGELEKYNRERHSTL